jgi:hypothetical protein
MSPREAAARLRAIDGELADLELEILERHVRQPDWWLIRGGTWTGAEHTTCAALHRRAAFLWLERVEILRCLRPPAPIPASRHPAPGRGPSRGPGAGASP